MKMQKMASYDHCKLIDSQMYPMHNITAYNKTCTLHEIWDNIFLLPDLFCPISLECDNWRLVRELFATI